MHQQNRSPGPNGREKDRERENVEERQHAEHDVSGVDVKIRVLPIHLLSKQKNFRALLCSFLYKLLTCI